MGFPECPPLDIACVDSLFQRLGIEMTPDNVEQFKALMQALMIYDDRTRAYGQVWKNYGALSNLLSLARKADRLMSLFWHRAEEVLTGSGSRPLLHKDNLDDAFDAINYAVFAIRNLRAGNISGYEPERPEEKTELLRWIRRAGG